MTIGIIIHSKTGHTLSVAETLKASLSSAGRPAVLLRIEDQPDYDSFDAILLGSHTEGFMLAQEMVAYLTALPEKTLSQKKTVLLITHAFPLHAMGGNQAMAGLRKLVEAKGAKVVAEKIIDWSRPGRERQIEAAVKQITSIL
ncbi:flavodoxin family protein [Acidaminobacter hydrogenoformans]|uniref:Flavodoxin n=1 Tax=Acidaminobacter hydrogenoformans DSM 2784 TaxID=1120920 RepID=A0A1G5RTV5_9FIRM|nr:flavodoxin domain-containing protein [Acidaminobacter hydrogenoformans]SCZ77140.1 Flavodoxin [Acidaminobacter hydrogenoformans DSM 2784]